MLKIPPKIIAPVGSLFTFRLCSPTGGASPVKENVANPGQGKGAGAVHLCSHNSQGSASVRAEGSTFQMARSANVRLGNRVSPGSAENHIPRIE